MLHCQFPLSGLVEFCDILDREKCRLDNLGKSLTPPLNEVTQ